MRAIAILLATTLCVPQFALADLRKNWTYKDLNKESDIIIIATPIKTVDLREDGNLLKERGLDIEICKLSTTFSVKASIKGVVEPESEITIIHYKVKKVNELVVEGSPNYVEFRFNTISLTKGKEKKIVPAPDYLLYLKKHKDGHYVPVSGDYDSSNSVFEVTKPWSDPTSIER